MDYKYLVYIIFFLQRNLMIVHAEETATIKMSDRVFTCSKWLSSIIDNLCNNAYKIVKRDTSAMLDKLSPKGLKRKERYITDERWRRVKRQVASECCERPCTVRTIIMYCPDDAKLLTENPDIFN
ncbi:insulin-like isoform X2 [Bicyclus anynana]|uniref:Insulin-like isoform X2 n=1 Tax=Bicyclus anynana TaxID=110368 RepID=A0A6J1NW40_BICAN|nr:insulin-like isoform X2 [Bicyclus anynana]